VFGDSFFAKRKNEENWSQVDEALLNSRGHYHEKWAVNQANNFMVI